MTSPITVRTTLEAINHLEQQSGDQALDRDQVHRLVDEVCDRQELVTAQQEPVGDLRGSERKRGWTRREIQVGLGLLSGFFFLFFGSLMVHDRRVDAFSDALTKVSQAWDQQARPGGADALRQAITQARPAWAPLADKVSVDASQPHMFTVSLLPRATQRECNALVDALLQSTREPITVMDPVQSPQRPWAVVQTQSDHGQACRFLNGPRQLVLWR